MEEATHTGLLHEWEVDFSWEKTLKSAAHVLQAAFLTLLQQEVQSSSKFIILRAGEAGKKNI